MPVEAIHLKIHRSLTFEGAWTDISLITGYANPQAFLAVEQDFQTAGRHRVSRARIRHIVDLAKAIRVSPVPTESIAGLDGTTFELAITAGWNRIEFHWWVRLPRGWRPIGEIAQELVTLAEPHLRHRVRLTDE